VNQIKKHLNGFFLEARTEPGVALRAAGSYRLAATLFGLSGPLGLVGILGIVAGGGWLALASRRD
ncbi:hypothetical protein FQA18_13025, partial [Haloferax volcanii]